MQQQTEHHQTERTGRYSVKRSLRDVAEHGRAASANMRSSSSENRIAHSSGRGGAR
jgi:hypothetical protein